MFIPNQTSGESEAQEADLAICDRNRRGAKENPEVTRDLWQKELDEGWLEEVPSAEAQERLKHVAMGKLSVVFTALRSSWIPQYAAPTLPVSYYNDTTFRRLLACRSRSRSGEVKASWGFFSLDIKAAHKTVRAKESERGRVGVQLDGKHYCNRVCPFGAGCWFQRVSSFFISAIHLLIFIAHARGMYGDDFLLWQDVTVLDLAACLVLAFCAAFGVPIPWPKVQFGLCVVWIGWQLMFRAGAVSLPDEKIPKLSDALGNVMSGSSCSNDTGAEASCNKLLTMSCFLCPFTQQLVLVSWCSAIFLDVQSILGYKNSDAEYLACCDGVSLLAAKLDVDLNSGSLRLIFACFLRMSIRCGDCRGECYAVLQCHWRPLASVKLTSRRNELPKRLTHF